MYSAWYVRICAWGAIQVYPTYPTFISGTVQPGVSQWVRNRSFFFIHYALLVPLTSWTVPPNKLDSETAKLLKIVNALFLPEWHPIFVNSWVAMFYEVAVQNSSEVLFAPVSPSRSMLLLALCCILCSRCRMEKLHTHMHCLLVKNNTAPVSHTYTCIHSVFCLFYSLTISDRFAGSVVIQVTGLCGCDCERDMVSFSIWYEWQQQLYVSLTVSSYAHTVCIQPY